LLKMGLLEWEKTITCPYNPAHQITPARLQGHLVKCRRNNPTAEVDICPFNCSHHFPKPERRYHLETCPDRKIVDLAIYDTEAEQDVIGIKPVCEGRMEELLDGEDWDAEPQLQSYDPEKKCSKSAVLRKVQGVTPSERKKFYAAERIRHEALLGASVKEEEEKVESSASIRRPVVPSISKDDFPPLSRATRPSVVRASLIRPGEVSEEIQPPKPQARQGSITMRLLQMVEKGPRSGETKNNKYDTVDSMLGRLALSRREAPPSIKE